MIKCRVFKEKFVWSNQIFFIPENISFEELKNHVETSCLSKYNYITINSFEETFLEKLLKRYINNKVYYTL